MSLHLIVLVICADCVCIVSYSEIVSNLGLYLWKPITQQESNLLTSPLARSIDRSHNMTFHRLCRQSNARTQAMIVTADALSLAVLTLLLLVSSFTVGPTHAQDAASSTGDLVLNDGSTGVPAVIGSSSTGVYNATGTTPGTIDNKTYIVFEHYVCGRQANDSDVGTYLDGTAWEATGASAQPDYIDNPATDAAFNDNTTFPRGYTQCWGRSRANNCLQRWKDNVSYSSFKTRNFCGTKTPDSLVKVRHNMHTARVRLNGVRIVP